MTRNQGVLYGGSFPLSFLDRDERIRSAGDGSGAAVIVSPRGSIRVEVGDIVIRGRGGQPLVLRETTDVGVT